MDLVKVLSADTDAKIGAAAVAVTGFFVALTTLVQTVNAIVPKVRGT
jgi:hypothetical protein